MRRKIEPSAKVHGPARDILFLNEAQNIPFDIARQLFVRTSERILIDYNPTHTFWVNERIEPREDCVSIHSTFKDNCDCSTGETFLSPEQIREIESNQTDANWWRVYGLGLVGQLEGLIFPDFEQIDELPAEGVETFGQDYGFTNDPSVMIHTKIDTEGIIYYCRVVLESKNPDEFQKECFRKYCEFLPSSLPYIRFFGGNDRSDWGCKNPVYDFGVPLPDIDEKHASTTALFPRFPRLDDLCPILYARLFNHRDIEQGTTHDWLMIDFVDVQ